MAQRGVTQLVSPLNVAIYTQRGARYSAGGPNQSAVMHLSQRPVRRRRAFAGLTVVSEKLVPFGHFFKFAGGIFRNRRSMRFLPANVLPWQRHGRLPCVSLVVAVMLPHAEQHQIPSGNPYGVKHGLPAVEDQH